MFGFLKKIFGTQQTRLVQKYRKLLPSIHRFEEEFQKLSDGEIQAKTGEFRKRVEEGASLESLLPEAFALVKNACRRLCGQEIHVSGYDQKWDMIPYDVQILGAIAMFHGSIAEMQTGEGKTLTASMPLYLFALSSKSVHLVTVNDYLAKRDAEWIGTIFRFLGLKVASLTNDVPLPKRKEVYAADIVYGTASEFGFDYLRDNSMAMHKNEQVQRGHFVAIIDEVDSICIDEARTPLIISGPVQESRQLYDELKKGVAHLVKAQRDLCNKIAGDAKKSLESLGYDSSLDVLPKMSKEAKEVCQRLWLVSKGTPRNKVLKKLQEHPDIRVEIDAWETFFCSEANKEQKHNILSELFLLVDERSNEYELTDKGIHAWAAFHGQEESEDFVLLDLGALFAEIDEDTSISEEEKIQEKMELREEDAKRKERAHNLRQMLRAHLLMEKDIDYIVQEGKIVIIDENTGRAQPGRRFSDGLHQAIEAKEEVAIQGETQTYATITLQNYFRLYTHLAGMTGTAMTEAQEFKEIYKLAVLEIPTYRPCQRKDFDDEVYMTEREKYHAIVQEVEKVHQEGRPILLGTDSVEVSEKLSRILKQHQLPHTILNAKHHAQEAAIIAEAGKSKAITLATNMAGRGTDIKLAPGVADLGGLHVIGTTRHPSRRIDRQLRGRSARLGDPGSSKFFVSFEDSLMRLFASPRMTALLQRFRPPEGEPISAKILNTSIETAQKRVEQRNYTSRKHTIDYDDVMNRQRQEVYAFRNLVLHAQDPLQLAREMTAHLVSRIGAPFAATKKVGEAWDATPFLEALSQHLPLPFEKKRFESPHHTFADIEKEAIETIETALQHKCIYQRQILGTLREDLHDIEKAQGVLEEVLRNIMVRKTDHLWQGHLLAIDHLRSDVHMRAVGQKDPLLEFKQEAFHLFGDFSARLETQILEALFRFEMLPQERPPTPTNLAPQKPQLVPLQGA